MSGDGGRTSELCVAMDTAEGIGQAIGSGTCSDVVGMQGTTGTTAGSNGEVSI